MTPSLPASFAELSPQDPTALTPLDPTALARDTQIAVQAILREGSSQNTVASYASALRYWCAWYVLRYGVAMPMPLTPNVLLQFIVDHAQRLGANGLITELPESIDAALIQSGVKAKAGAPSLNTLLHRISVMSKAHTVGGYPNPCQDQKVRTLLAKTRAAYAKRGETAKKKKALTRLPLEAIVATCDGSLRGKRDRALLLFGWSSGGRRRAEITYATRENVQATDNGYLYTLQYSKTNQRGSDRAANTKPIVGVAAAALAEWLSASGITEGAIFRRIRRGGVVAEPLAPAAVRAIVQARCALAGLTGDFSAHSLRSGFITEAARQSVPLGDIMALTGQTSVATVMGYYQAGQLDQSKALRLLDDE